MSTSVDAVLGCIRRRCRRCHLPTSRTAITIRGAAVRRLRHHSRCRPRGRTRRRAARGTWPPPRAAITSSAPPRVPREPTMPAGAIWPPPRTAITIRGPPTSTSRAPPPTTRSSSRPMPPAPTSPASPTHDYHSRRRRPHRHQHRARRRCPPAPPGRHRVERSGQLALPAWPSARLLHSRAQNSTSRSVRSAASVVSKSARATAANSSTKGEQLSGVRLRGRRR
jgi:hypothetical protein